MSLKHIASAGALGTVRHLEGALKGWPRIVASCWSASTLTVGAIPYMRGNRERPEAQRCDGFVRACSSASNAGFKICRDFAPNRGLPNHCDPLQTGFVVFVQLHRSTRLKGSPALPLRQSGDSHQVFLVHPGGPLWVKKDEGVWTLPKGEYDDGEEPLVTAQREFHEETGFVASGPFLELGSIRQKSGKVVTAWAFSGDCDPPAFVSNSAFVSNTVVEQRLVIPEVDRGGWSSIASAHVYISDQQRILLSRVEQTQQEAEEV